MFRLIVPISGLLLLLACSSGNSEENDLVLRGGTLTESEFRTQMRAALTSMPNAEAFCNSIEGLSGGEAADVFKEINKQRGDSDPVQESIREDEVRAGEIVIEECDRIS